MEGTSGVEIRLDDHDCHEFVHSAVRGRDCPWFVIKCRAVRVSQ